MTVSIIIANNLGGITGQILQTYELNAIHDKAIGAENPTIRLVHPERKPTAG